jgi:hypothetical protein
VRSNCWVFVWRRWWQRGGYAVLTKSRYGWWLHVVWSADLITFEEFAPPVKYRHWLPPLWFRGGVKRWTPKGRLLMKNRHAEDRSHVEAAIKGSHGPAARVQAAAGAMLTNLDAHIAAWEELGTKEEVIAAAKALAAQTRADLPDLFGALLHG